MAKLSSYSNAPTPLITDKIPITSGGATYNLPLSYLSRGATKIVAPSSLGIVADYYTDGIADDVQLQQAFDAISAAGVGTVIIRGGTYDITAIMTFPSNIVIVGEGAKTILKANATLATTINMLQNADTTNGNTEIHIRDLALDGNETNRTGKANGRDESGHNLMFKRVTYSSVKNVISYAAASSCITFAQGTSYSIVENCKIYSSWNHNLLIVGGRTGPVECTKNIIKHNVVYSAGLSGNTQGVGIEIANYATENTIIGNISSNNKEGGIHTYYHSNKNTISGNVMENNQQNGIAIVDMSEFNVYTNNIITGSTKVGIDATTDTLAYGGKNCIISNNIISGCGWNGIRANVTTDLSNSIITGNKIDSCGLTAPSGNGQEGLYINTADSITISDNHVTNSGRRGISIDALTNSKLNNNYSASNPSHGISVNGCTRTTINGNTSINNLTYGIVLQKDSGATILSTYNTFLGNICYNNTSGGIVESTGAANFNIYIGNNCNGNTTNNFVTVGANDVSANNITT